jgi:hypothetical protein
MTREGFESMTFLCYKLDKLTYYSHTQQFNKFGKVN